MRAEVLWQSDDVGIGVTEVGIVFDDAIGVRPSTGHDRGTRGRANRLLAVGSIKKEPLRGKFVDVRGNRNGRAIAPELGTHVIDCNEENVGPF